MNTLYIILAVIIGLVVASTTFVVVGAIEKHRKVNINWVLLMLAIILSCTLAMVLIYHSENDKEVAQTSYDQGYKDGVASEHHTYPNNEEMEEWFSKTEKVIVGSNGTDAAVHIVDGNGEEWVLYADEVVEK